MPALRFWDGNNWVDLPVGGPPPAPMDTWHTVGAAGEPAFQNSWVNFGSTYPSAAFRKDPFGKVRMRGAIKSGTINQTAFTLPAGYRPVAYQQFLTPQGVQTNGYTGALIEVKGDGTVGIYVSGTATNGFIDLGEVEFDTDTVVNAVTPMTATTLDPWHTVGNPGEPAFTNSWANYDATRVARFRRYPDGRVRLAGVIRAGTSGSAAFTLPVGYWPPKGASADTTCAVVASGGAAQVNIYGDGRVVPTNLGTSAVATFVYLDGVEFDTETVPQWAPAVAQIPYTVQNSGTALPARTVQNFHGPAAIDDPVNARTLIGTPISYAVSLVGNNGTISTAATALPGLAISFTTPPYPVHADVFWAARFDTGSVAWYYIGTWCGCSPASGGQIAGVWSNIASTYSGAQSYLALTAADRFILNASTTYTLQVYAQGQVASGQVWNNGTASFLMARLHPR